MDGTTAALLVSVWFNIVLVIMWLFSKSRNNHLNDIVDALEKRYNRASMTILKLRKKYNDHDH